MSNKEDGFQIPAGSLISIDERYVPLAQITWVLDEARTAASELLNTIERSTERVNGEQWYRITTPGPGSHVHYATEA